MSKKISKTKTTKRRTKIQNLPIGEKELTTSEKKKVKGGKGHTGGVNVAMADGSVRFITDGTSNTVLPAIQK